MSSKNTPICAVVIMLIICNLITLHFLNKSVHRTSSMHCPNYKSNHIANINANSIKDLSQNNNFPNLLQGNSQYSHLPYLPHNLNNYVNQNRNDINDPNFIEAIKKNTINQEKGGKQEGEGESEQDPTSIDEKFQISLQILRPTKPITIKDEMDRNGIVRNEELWDNKINKLTENETICDNSIEYLFNNTIHTLHKLKGRNYMESMICPNVAKLGWRHASYVPFIFGNHCEPWWARDAVFIISKLLNKNMIGIEWGTGISSLWLSMLTNFTIAMEHDRIWQIGVKNIQKQLNINNLLVLQEHLGRRYCDLDYSNSFADSPGGHKWEKGTIDYFSVDGRLRYPSTEWMLDWIKPHGGILIFDNSDRVEIGNKYGQHNATNLIPKHWLRYDSSYFKQHIDPIRDKRWLQNSMTTIWITRHKQCAKGTFETNNNNEEQLNFKPF